ncbi:RluA family pseudouridine synthase [Candidatus Acetothermia bacterium]|nr:RluA family pseudouridine synthase [Candidatus Acetothermia bacterium]MBI3659001.1 RluA family pseudouridine synthase [Candidatus Acetothermia bacterium]
MPTRQEFFTRDEDIGQRLDRWLAERLEHSRTQIQAWIKLGHVLVNGSAARASRLLEPGDSVVIEIPDPVSETVAPEAIPLEILFEDNSIIAVNKPSGMVVYPAAGHNSGTLINGLLAHCSLAHIGAPRRPGVVHRLDAGTSGVIVVAKTDSAYHHLVNQFKNSEIFKTYLALVQGRIAEDEGLIDAPLGRDPHDYQRMKVTKSGKPAVTEFRVLKKFKQQTLVEAYPKTGRTHQIRVHFQAIGHPVMGDEKYGREPVIKTRLYLHAWELKLWHPSTGQRLQLTAPLPLEFASLLDAGTAASHSASNRPPTHTREKSPHK